MLNRFRKPLPAVVLLGALVILGATGCKEDAKTSLNTESVAFTREGLLNIYQGQSDTVRHEVVIEIAETEYETQTGLMYRKNMDDSAGMLFIFPDERMHSFYMKNTHIALDILFIRGDLTVANIARNTKPLDETGIPSAEPVQYVLEINAGMSERWGIEPGDRIQFWRNEEE